MNNNKSAWEKSYENHDNFVFYPHEEVIRFVSRHIRKRVSLDGFAESVAKERQGRILDLGCGIGRHVIYCHEMGLEAYGIDLSEVAVGVAREWAARKGVAMPQARIVQGDVRKLPWPDAFFTHAVSHGVLDSMPFEIARAACAELARAMVPGGLFYCDLISGDDSAHAREYAGEQLVSTAHERDTIQSYFNLAKIQAMIEGSFEITECNLIRRENVLAGGFISRYHLVLSRRA